MTNIIVQATGANVTKLFFTIFSLLVSAVVAWFGPTTRRVFYLWVTPTVHMLLNFILYFWCCSEISWAVCPWRVFFGLVYLLTIVLNSQKVPYSQNIRLAWKNVIDKHSSLIAVTKYFLSSLIDITANKARLFVLWMFQASLLRE
jgi:hypothetical protein